MTNDRPARRLAVIALLLGAASACFGGATQPPASPAPAAPAASPAAAAKPAGPVNYRGRVTLPDGQEIALFVKVSAEGKATISIPAQDVTDEPVGDFVLTADRMAFTLSVEGMPADAAAKFDVALQPDGSGKGSIAQAGRSMPLVVAKMGADEAFGPRRPQNPVGPFPYESRDVTLENPKDKAVLAGTLTWPKGEPGTRHPAVILITGSGPQDRDETLLTHKPFLVIADHLSRRGFAVLRLDDRGVGGSTSPTPGPDSLVFAGDISAAADFLAKQPEVDPARIGLVGHSEGGLIAPIVASERSDIAFIVMLAGPGVPGREILREQLIAIQRASGVKPEDVERAATQQAIVLDAVAKGADEATVLGLVRQAIGQAMAAMPDAPPPEELNEQIEASAAQQARALTGGWMRTFIRLDPRTYLQKVRCPVLALNGELDLQVLPTQNMPEVVGALLRGGNGDVTAVVLPGLNHLFQTARTGSPNEYMLIDETFAPKALDVMSRWLRLRAGLDPWPKLDKPSALPLPAPGGTP
ncbi:MAG: alpha/beta fold hydrolase [Phycisphaerae bacterium]|nr:alpha/beta fold hydrolase [Phycisphaerae bacterium]